MVLSGIKIKEKNIKKSNGAKILSVEDQLVSIDGEGWNDVDINLGASDFLDRLKNDVLDYDKKHGCKMD